MSASNSANQIQTATAQPRRDSIASDARTTLTQAVAFAQQQQQQQQQAQAQQGSVPVLDTSTPLTEQQELMTLRQIIVTWRELETEVSNLSQEMREKKKRQKALEEMIMRIMKKYNIGALDLKGSGGRLLYRQETKKCGLTPKVLVGLLANHLKSETAAAEAIKYINENRAAKVRESLLYEKD